MDLNQLKKIQKNLRQVNRSKVEQFFSDELIANESNITDRVKSRWDVGERPNGGIIGTYRSAEYALFKYNINPQAKGNVDLTLTRALRNGLRLFPLGNSDFKIFSDDEKAVLIAQKYGEDVYGLNENEEQIELKDAAEGTHERLFEFTGI